MTQLSFFETTFWTITNLTRYLRELIESDENLQDLWVQGEVSNLSRPSSGHVYFTLKDTACSLRCVMWRTAAGRQTYLPKDGDAVEVHGNVNVYEAAGQYQLYADLIRPAGEGMLYREFLRLKARLEAEGLFEPERKRPIPRWPRRIGIVTSPTGAALRDMLNTLQRRYPLVEVVLAPTPVQGEEAPPGVTAAIRALNRLASPDVILVARGGGSIEDLWAFNDEQVARAIVASQTPIITGVGHETDFTIADFASDLRAPTPTAAAELATPNRMDLITAQAELRQRMARAVQNTLTAQRWQLNRLENRLALRSPQARIHSDRQRLDDFVHRATVAINHHLELQRLYLSSHRQRLLALNPVAVLGRGFAVVTQADGRIVRSVHQVQPGEQLSVRLSDGQFVVQVRETGEDIEAR